MNLFNVLRENSFIEIQTIVSLIKYGFDSSDSLMALDIDLDLPKMTDISDQQKRVLKDVLTECKQSIVDQILAQHVDSDNDLDLDLDLEVDISDQMPDQMLRSYDSKLLEPNGEDSSERMSGMADMSKNSTIDEEMRRIDALFTDKSIDYSSAVSLANISDLQPIVKCSSKVRKRPMNSTPKPVKSFYYYVCYTGLCDRIRFNRLVDIQEHIRNCHFNKSPTIVDNLIEKRSEFQPIIHLNPLTDEELKIGSIKESTPKTKNKLMNGLDNKRRSTDRPTGVWIKPKSLSVNEYYICFTDNCGQKFAELSEMQNHIRSKHFRKPIEV